jgi:excinuclease ABC subunit C
MTTKIRELLQDKLDALPTKPGVYLMKDEAGQILYVGKAINLRARVRQYFQPATGDTRAFVPLLEGIVADIETVVTGNEKEALLLENNLIKRQQPRFNVKLTDDKSFLVLRLDTRGPWPRLEVVRKLADDGARYFGPYHSPTACREALRVVNRHFQLRVCTDHTLHSRQRPCLQYQIKRCLAPCVLDVPPTDYAEQVRFVSLFLEGKSDELLEDLRGRMKEAAARQAFEHAATLRDQIRALESVLQSQRIVSDSFVDQDVVGFFREGQAVEIVVLFVRQGKLVGNRAFSFGKQEFPDDEILSSFLGLFYDLQAGPPAEVLLPFGIADAQVKAEWLADKRGKKCAVLIPQRGPRRALLDLARKNAAASFVSRRDHGQDSEATLARLQRRLGLPRPPRVIECFDISHVQGSDPVASMVVFENGEPAKHRYRTYRIRHAQGGDDFASMYEVLSRRFRRGREASSDDRAWRLPDLLVVDGGKGQLGVALAAARDVGIDVRPGAGLPIVALAKERDLAGGETATPSAEPATTEPAPSPVAPAPAGRRPDRIFLAHGKDPIPIGPTSAEMFVLARLRDEAHRFAVSFHRSRRKRRTLRTALSSIPSVGPSRQRALLRHFGSLRKVGEANLEALAAVPGMNEAAARAVRDYFASHPIPTPPPKPPPE